MPRRSLTAVESNLNHYTLYELPQIFSSVIPRLIEIWDKRQYLRILLYCKPDLFEVDIIADIRLPPAMHKVRYRRIYPSLLPQDVEMPLPNGFDGHVPVLDLPHYG